MDPRRVLEDAAKLLPRVVDGEPETWRVFMSAVQPALVAILRRSRFLGAHRGDEDASLTVAVQVLDRLQKNGFRALRLFPTWVEAHPGKSFADWIHIVAANRARDYAAAARPALERTLPPVFADTISSLEPTGPRLGFRPLMTDAIAARQLLSCARRTLPEVQRHGLHRWLEGASFDEIAPELGLEDARDAERLVRAALARLRRLVREA